MQWRELKSDQDSSLFLKPTPSLELLVNQFSAIPENDNDPENISSAQYYDTDEKDNK